MFVLLLLKVTSDQSRQCTGGRKPSYQANSLGLESAGENVAVCIYNCHLLLLHSPKTDTHFGVAQRVEN